MLHFVQLFLLEIKASLFFEDLLSLRLQSLTCLLNFLSQRFEFDLFLLEVYLILFKLDSICLDQLSFLLQKTLLSSKLMLGVREQLLAVFHFDLLDLDLADVVFPLLRLQLLLLFVKEFERILNLVLLI